MSSKAPVSETFGRITVAVNFATGSCAITHPARGLIGEVAKTFTLRTIEEIRGAYEVHTRFAKQPKKNPHSADMAAALKFAGMHLGASQGGKR